MTTPLLPHYTRILHHHDTAQYLTTKHTPTTTPNHTRLDVKTTTAYSRLASCTLCERACHTNRHTHAGPCHTQESRIACEFLHTGEEPPLVPSHTIFFSGCTLHCIFCQNYDISQSNTGDSLTPAQLAERITLRANQGSKNVNWVGGDPTSNLPYILAVLQELDLNIPQIWNSNMYCSRDTMDLLSGIIDLYLTDFKFGNDACAKRLADADNYLAVVQRNHLLASHDGDVLVRHLLLPGHIDCCTKPIIDWLADNLPTAAINLMAQYHPEYHANDYPELRRRITSAEYASALHYATMRGLHLL